MKNLTDFRKTVETGVDPRLDLVVCSRRSDSVARAKNMATEKKPEKTRSPSFFSRFFRSLYFAPALHYLNAWNRLVTTGISQRERGGGWNSEICFLRW